jgi:tRNA nucleotidyltransferase (CCA-adding enzyme)
MSDYNFLMESRLSSEQNAVISLIGRLAAEHGQSLYLAGGAVRDLTYGQQVVRDLDFIVEGPPQRILRSIPATDSIKASRGARTPVAEPPLSLDYYSLDEYFNSVELVFSNGVRAEMAMCREAVFTRPGQRPEVLPAGIFEDLKGRDFAINAMAVSLHPNSRGLLLDPTNGAGDIERHEIRTLRSRSFIDDPSRIYRLLRLGLRLDFKADERTQQWFDAALAEHAWERLDADQQARELAAILHEDQPGRILKMLSDKKLLGGLDKKLASVHLSYDRFARVRSVLQNAPGADPFLLNFHCLVEKLGGENAARLAKKIIGDSKAIKLALSLDQEARKLEKVLSSAKAELPSHVYALLTPQPQALLLYLLANTKSAKVQNRIKSALFKFPQIRARLPRTELQALGVKPGPEFDNILARILDMQLDGKIKSHPQLMKEMRELAGIKEPPPPPPPPPMPAPRKGREKHAGIPAGQKKGKEAASAPEPAPVTAQHKGKHATVAAPAPVAPARTAPKPVAKGSAPKSVAGKPASKPTAASKSTPAAKHKGPAKPTPKVGKKAKKR